MFEVLELVARAIDDGNGVKAGVNDRDAAHSDGQKDTLEFFQRGRHGGTKTTMKTLKTTSTARTIHQKLRKRRSSTCLKS